MNLIEERLLKSNPLERPCRQTQLLELEGISTSKESWNANVETIRGLRGLAEREELPPDLSSFTYVVGADANSDSDAGRGAWTRRRLGTLLTKEFLDGAVEEYARASSGAGVNGWH